MTSPDASANIPAASISPEFVISVTGQRDIAESDIAALRQQLQIVFKEIRSRFQHLPIRMVPGLAKGPDTLATEVALEMDLAGRSVLLMPLESYFEGFTGEALKKSEFCEKRRHKDSGTSGF